MTAQGAHRAPGGAGGRRPLPILALVLVLALLAWGAARVDPAIAETPSQRYPDALVLSGDRSGSVDVEVTSDLLLAPIPGLGAGVDLQPGTGPSGAIATTEGALSGFLIERLPDGELVHAVVRGPAFEERTGEVERVGFVGAEPEVFNPLERLPAGRYRLSLVTDGPAEVRIPLRDGRGERRLPLAAPRPTAFSGVQVLQDDTAPSTPVAAFGPLALGPDDTVFEVTSVIVASDGLRDPAAEASVVVSCLQQTPVGPCATSARTTSVNASTSGINRGIAFGFFRPGFFEEDAEHEARWATGSAGRNQQVAVWMLAVRGARPSEVVRIGDPAPTAERLAGADRIATAVAVSQATYPRASTAVLARSDVYADALAGAPLAAHRGGPLLLSSPDRLPSATIAELRRLRTTQVVLLGGTAALGLGVEADLEALGIDVERLDGPDRFATAAAIAAALPPSDDALLAEGANADPARGWPDAITAAALGARTSTPVLLATRDELPAATRRALRGRDVRAVGGTAALSDEVLEDAARVAGTVTRLAGADRYDTSAAAARVALDDGADPYTMWLATGRDWPDALAGAAAAGRDRSILLLVDGRSATTAPVVLDLLTEAEPRRLRALGGRAAIDGAALTALVRHLR